MAIAFRPVMFFYFNEGIMKMHIAVTLLIGALLAPAGYAADRPATPAAKDDTADSSIANKIKNEFAKDKTVSATKITVDTEDSGVVTLGGNAKTKTEADQAIKIARDTSGVISVKNNIVVGEAVKKSGPESVKEDVADTLLTARIKAEFAKDKTVSAMRVKVDTNDKGVVTLSGTARSKAEAEQAVSLARNTKGVTSVKNEIAVEAK